VDGQSFAAQLSPDAGSVRENAIVAAILDGQAEPLVWCPIDVVTPNGKHKGTVFVASRVVTLGSVNPLLPTVGHIAAQNLADHCDDDGLFYADARYGAVLPTAKLSDLTYLAAPKKLLAHTQPADPAERRTKGYSPYMRDTAAMARHSAEVADELGDTAQDVLAAPMGKDWACTIRLVGHPDRSANYGLQTERGHDYSAIYQGVISGVIVWQPGPGLAHEATYDDYSQVVRLVRRKMLVNGAERDIEDVARDPELCWLVSSEGVMKSLRHPGVPRPGDTAPPATVRPSLPLFTRLLRYVRPPASPLAGDDVRVWQNFLAGWDSTRK